jgi:hypothetical protein
MDLIGKLTFAGRKVTKNEIVFSPFFDVLIFTNGRIAGER